MPRHFEADVYDRFGTDWVSHQHLDPTSGLLQWAKHNGVVFVTTVRHPADVLVSLCNYVMRFDGEELLQEALRQDDGSFGDHVTAYVRKSFFVLMNQSVSWLRTGRSAIVRYEELWREPVETLRKLTDGIQHVPSNAIEDAVRSCSLESMKRQSTGKDRQFFQKGGTDNWRDVLPAEIVGLLANADPYPNQFAALGYRMTPWDDTETAAARTVTSKPFRPGTTAFRNGIPFAPIIADCYAELPSDVQARWPNPVQIEGRDSFFAWLNKPRGIVGHGECDTAPLLTNLAAYIHESRGGTQGTFPRLSHDDPVAFCMWFVVHARGCFQLAPEFVRPVQQQFRGWATKYSAASLPAEGPPLSNLAHYVYASRADLRQDYPTLESDSRIGFARWFVQHARRDYALDKSILKPMSRDFYCWANRPFTADPRRGCDLPPMVTNFAAYLHRSSPHLRESFPDPFDRDRVRYTLWFARDYCATEAAGRRLAVPIVRSWARDSFERSAPLTGAEDHEVVIEVRR